ncbi:hypothetical protein OOK41_15180 [Micromonospora sp. NBC_01655]|uniref:hypothetical protein n=1 Tax=Micromonospora sp. NBC_01655 TaxID=2975983 RepID=UPI00224DBD32|nr:hypothetical protein [Micromonospora sp. NBC_01655]MCX4471628.1 hypothetical protein [Micromonospora sp. NBC_01655]
MTSRTPIDGAPHATKFGTLVLAVLAVLAAGCSRSADTVESRATADSPSSPNPSPSTAAMRLDQPEKLLGSWNESVDRRLIELAEKNMGAFKEFLAGEPTSAVGTAYTAVKEKYSPGLGVHRPDDSRFILLSGVSGTVTAPEAVLDAVFAGLTAVTDVEPVQPGPLGGIARCGTSKNKGIRVDVCAWAGPHTLGMVHFGGFARTDSPDQMFRRIRSEAEHPAG